MRCAEHDLAFGPEGECVLCKRRATAVGRASAGRGVAIAFAAVLGVSAVAAAVRVATMRDGVPHALATEQPIEVELPDIDWSKPTNAARTAFGSATTGGANGARGATDAAWQSALPNVKMIVYSTTWCPSCKAAKKWLAANGVPYENRDIDAFRTYAIELKALTGRSAIPTFDIDGSVTVGFSPEEITAMRERAAKVRAGRGG